MMPLRFIQPELLFSRDAGFVGYESGLLGQLKQLPEDVLPIGIQDGAAADEEHVILAGKVGAQVAVGFPEQATLVGGLWSMEWSDSLWWGFGIRQTWIRRR